MKAIIWVLRFGVGGLISFATPRLLVAAGMPLDDWITAVGGKIPGLTLSPDEALWIAFFLILAILALIEARWRPAERIVERLRPTKPVLTEVTDAVLSQTNADVVEGAYGEPDATQAKKQPQQSKPFSNPKPELMSADEAMALLISLPGTDWDHLFRDGAHNIRFRTFGRKMVNDHLTKLTEGDAGSRPETEIHSKHWATSKLNDVAQGRWDTEPDEPNEDFPRYCFVRVERDRFLEYAETLKAARKQPPGPIGIRSRNGSDNLYRDCTFEGLETAVDLQNESNSTFERINVKPKYGKKPRKK